jgi:hypothetical protein
VTLKLQFGTLAEGEPLRRSAPVAVQVIDRAAPSNLRCLPAQISTTFLEDRPACLWGHELVVRNSAMGRWLAAYDYPRVTYDLEGRLRSEPLPFEELRSSPLKDAITRAFFHNAFLFELRTSREQFTRSGAEWHRSLSEAFGSQALVWMFDESMASALECRLASPALGRGHKWRTDGCLPPELRGREELMAWFHAQ